MSLIDILADVSGVVKQLRRIADALERRYPPPAPTPKPSAKAKPHQEEEPVFHFAESPEQYQQRVSHESDLAISLGVAPWSPAFQKAIEELRSDIMKPRQEQSTNEQGEIVSVTREYSEAEADDVIRESFRLAQASALLQPEQRDEG